MKFAEVGFDFTNGQKTYNEVLEIIKKLTECNETLHDFRIHNSEINIKEKLEKLKMKLEVFKNDEIESIKDLIVKNRCYLDENIKNYDNLRKNIMDELANIIDNINKTKTKEIIKLSPIKTTIDNATFWLVLAPIITSTLTAFFDDELSNYKLGAIFVAVAFIWIIYNRTPFIKNIITKFKNKLIIFLDIDI